MRAWSPYVLTVTCLVLVIALPTGHADDSEAFSLQARIPSGSFGIVSIESVGKLGERLGQTSIAKLVNSPEMKPFVDPIRTEVEALWNGEGGGAGPLDDVPPIAREMFAQVKGLRGQLAFAVLGMKPGADLPTMVGSLDFGSHLADFETFLSRVKAEMGEEGERIQKEEREGRTWWHVDTGGPVIHATTIDTAFVFAFDADTLAGVITANPATSMAASADYKSVRAKAGGDALGLFAYANVPALATQFLGDDAPRDVKQIARILGLDTVKAAAYGMAFQGDGFMDTLVIHTPGAEHGLAPLGLLPPMRPQALGVVPPNAFYYGESALPLGDLLPRIRGLVAKADPDGVAEFDKGVSDLGQQLGVDIGNELLAGLGNGLAYYATMPETGGLYPEVVVMLRVKDEAAYRGVFERFTNGLAGMITEQGDVIASTRKIEYHGETLNLFEMQAARGRSVIPFTPTWTVRDGWLTLTLVPYSLKELILRTSTPSTGQNLATQEDFQSLMSHRPANNGGIEYLDLQAILGLLYDTGVPLLQTLVKPNMLGDLPITLDWAQLPPARSVRKYFRSMMSYGSWTKDGIQLSVHAPIPMLAVAVLAVGLGVTTYAMMDRANEARRMPRIEITPEEGRGSIGLGGSTKGTAAKIGAQRILRYVRLYRLENGDFPASIQDLVKHGIMKGVPNDPWGNAYELFEGKGEGSRGVRSAGPDGQMKTADDIEVGAK